MKLVKIGGAYINLDAVINIKDLLTFDASGNPIQENITIQVNNDQYSLTPQAAAALVNYLNSSVALELNVPAVRLFHGTTEIPNSGSFPFPGTSVGTPLTQTFTVTNAGTSDLTLATPITVPAGFTLASSFGSTTLAPGASTTFAVQFGAAAGTASGMISFASNDPYHNPFQFDVTASATFQKKFDFGAAGSPVAAGYLQVTEATTYNPTQGYGWTSGTIYSVDRGTGTDLARDFNFTADGTFAVDLPNGSYNVTVLLGDLGPYAHDQMGLFLQGAQVDTVSAAAGQMVTKTYPVTISTGQLVLRLQDLGGSDPFATIASLEVVSS
ncbi:MAG: choice-of-anchor D domain-containing protein [Isosphaeraceae bacterium]|nr:choice-of-anchor D domain-containing protein [Isosphaeraceae bacterium]